MSSALPVAILAGGLATRLRPITEKVPKLLLDVAGEPFFTHQIRLLKKAGLTRLVLCVGHLGEKIADLYGDGAADTAAGAGNDGQGAGSWRLGQGCSPGRALRSGRNA